MFAFALIRAITGHSDLINSWLLRLSLLILSWHEVGVVIGVVLPSFSSGGLLGFLVSSALRMLAHFLLLLVTNNRVRSEALDLWLGLLVVLLTLSLLGRLLSSLALTTGRVAAVTTASTSSG